jgi:hypothetical protein
MAAPVCIFTCPVPRHSARALGADAAMINRVTGEIDFSDGLRIVAHCTIQALSGDFGPSLKIETHTLSHKDWKRHVLGFHKSEHGNFEVEALSAEDDFIHVVLLSHWHTFYEVGTPEDTERRAFHQGVVSSDLGGQREFAWGEVLCRLEQPANKDWLVVAYNRESRVPLPEREVLLRLCAHKRIPGDNT